MALGKLIRAGLAPETSPSVKLYECGECNSTFERIELRKGVTCPACGADRLARANTVDTHT